MVINLVVLSLFVQKKIQNAICIMAFSMPMFVSLKYLVFKSKSGFCFHGGHHFWSLIFNLQRNQINNRTISMAKLMICNYINKIITCSYKRFLLWYQESNWMVMLVWIEQDKCGVNIKRGKGMEVRNFLVYTASHIENLMK